MKTTLLILMLSSLTLFTRGQGQGYPETLPDISLNVVNAFKEPIRLSSFTDRPLLIDLWATWCGSCIQLLPKMDSIKRHYKDRLNIVAISNETPETILKFLSSYEAGNPKPDVLFASEPKYALGKTFKVRFIPRYIWVAKGGRVVGNTDENAITTENLNKFVNGQTIALATKVDVPRLNFDFSKPLLLDSNMVKRMKIHKYSILTGPIPGSPSMHSRTLKGDLKNRRVFGMMASATGLYRIAYGNNQPGHCFRYNKIVFETINDDDYNVNTKSDSINESRLFCYELIIDRPDSTQLFDTFKKDLDQAFGLKAKVEKRLMKSLVLRLDGKQKPSKSKVLQGSINSNEYGLQMKGFPISKFAKTLDEDIYVYPGAPAQVFDETGFSLPIDMKINVSLRNIALLKSELKKYHIIATEEYRDVEVLVL